MIKILLQPLKYIENYLKTIHRSYKEKAPFEDNKKFHIEFHGGYLT